MSLYITGLSMPKETGDLLCINIWPNGNVTIAKDLECKPVAKAVELPKHGDLIDRDEFNMFICKSCGDRCNCESIETDCISCESAFRCDFVPILKIAPVVVPAEREDNT